MTTVTVSVDATRRLARFELSPQFTPTGKVFAHDEILVQEPATPSKDAEIFGVPKEGEEGQVTYGTMYGATVERDFSAVLDQSVTVDGMIIPFQTLLDAAAAFFELWRQQDIANPPVLTGSTDERP